jgi:two-component system, NtrC family, sensor kinase
MNLAAAQRRIAQLEKANRTLRRKLARQKSAQRTLAQRTFTQVPPYRSPVPAQLQQVIHDLRHSHSDLEHRRQTLEATLAELQATQSKLIAAEKMSALGTMVAGVAHEINNPINFVHGNLAHVSLYTQDLLHLLQIYRREFPKTSSDLQIAIEAIDLPFLEQDLKKTLKSMWGGTERIRKIVESLRTFARLDEADCKLIDLHESLESTIVVVQNRFQANEHRAAIKLVCDFAPMPAIECYGSAINQVFLQLLNNAIDAINDQAIRGVDCEMPPQIQIQTNYTDSPSCITVNISDNGCGIPESIISKIFDPFFTTKAIGYGTGLGLSTSYQTIVAQHHGQFYCRSVVGQGSEFVIILPIRGVCDWADNPAVV